MYIVVYVYIKPRLRSHMWFNLFMESRSHIYRFSILLKYKDGQMFNLRYCIFSFSHASKKNTNHQRTSLKLNTCYIEILANVNV